MCEADGGYRSSSGAACCSPDFFSTDAGDGGGSCPMAEFVGRLSSRPGIWSYLLIPGLVLVLVGVLILIAPQVLVWLLAGVSILLGLGLLWVAGAIRRWLGAPATI